METYLWSPLYSAILAVPWAWGVDWGTGSLTPRRGGVSSCIEVLWERGALWLLHICCEILSWSGRQSPVFIPKTFTHGNWGRSRTFYLHPSFPPFVSAKGTVAPTSRTHWGNIYINRRVDSPQGIYHRLMSDPINPIYLDLLGPPRLILRFVSRSWMMDDKSHQGSVKGSAEVILFLDRFMFWLRMSQNIHDSDMNHYDLYPD